MLYLGVDLGGTNIKAALVNSEGEILCEANTPTNLPRPAEAVCDDIAALCLQLAEGKDVAGVGVGCPGTVDGGTVLYSNNLDWHDFAMEEYLAQKTGLPIAVGNDANVAALGEALAGCAKGAQSSVVVTLGTGVGAGVVLDGKLLTGYTGAASEAGHMVILDTADAPRCTCGRHQERSEPAGRGVGAFLPPGRSQLSGGRHNAGGLCDRPPGLPWHRLREV